MPRSVRLDVSDTVIQRWTWEPALRQGRPQLCNECGWSSEADVTELASLEHAILCKDYAYDLRTRGRYLPHDSLERRGVVVNIRHGAAFEQQDRWPVDVAPLEME